MGSVYTIYTITTIQLKIPYLHSDLYLKWRTMLNIDKIFIM